MRCCRAEMLQARLFSYGDAQRYAEDSPFPDPATLEVGVYAEN